MTIYRCRTQEEYDWLMNKLEADGYSWSPTEQATALNVWKLYKEQTCVHAFIGYIFADKYDYYKDVYSYAVFVEVSEMMVCDAK